MCLQKPARLPGIVLTLFLFIFLQENIAQNTFQRRIEKNALWLSGIISKPDSTFLLGLNDFGGAKLLRIDRFGNVTGGKAWADDQYNYNCLRSLGDGKQILTGYRSLDGVVTIIDPTDEILWSVRHRMKGMGIQSNIVSEVRSDADGNIYGIGHEGMLGKGYLIKLDPSGNYQWTRQTDQVLTGLEISADGQVWLLSVSGTDSYAWELDGEGHTVSCYKFHSDSMSLAINGLVFGMDGSRLISFQTWNFPRKQLGLVKVDEQGQVVWAKEYINEYGFRELCHFKALGWNDYLLTANVINPEYGSEPYPPYHSFIGVFDAEGQLRFSRRYHADWITAGLTDEVLTFDGGTLLADYLLEDSTQLNYPLLVKLDSAWNSGCYQDSVPLVLHSFDISCTLLTDSLDIRIDTVIHEPVVLTDIPACSGMNFCYLDIEDPLKESGPMCYPNPAGEFLIISVPSEEIDISDLCVVNGLGQLLMKVSPEPGKESIILNIKSLCSGMYFLKMVLDGECHFIKFIRH